MKKKVLLLDADEKQSRKLCVVLREGGYHATAFQTLSDLQKYLCDHDSLAVILDLDTFPLNNRTIRALALENPGIYLLGVSKERFHPELKDAICYHLYACINKLPDPEELQDELFYWLKSIDEEEAEPEGPSG